MASGGSGRNRVQDAQVRMAGKLEIAGSRVISTRQKAALVPSHPPASPGR